MKAILSALAFFGFCIGCTPTDSSHGDAPKATYDVVLRNGAIYDGSGNAPVAGGVAVKGDRIALVGDMGDSQGEVDIDVEGQAIAPGFINMLSWGVEGLIEDGRGLSDVRQGVTLEVFGEGVSYGPWTEEIKKERKERQTDIQYDIEWSTLGEYLEFLERRGVSSNIASFVGATTLRAIAVGYENRDATEGELAEMQTLVREAMREGALGVGSSLIYAPAHFANTDELIALASAAGEFDGMYISHMRNEGHKLLESLDELIEIAREADVPAEIYHLKASGESNWHKLDQVIEKVEAARDAGLNITADVYTYPASSTGLDAAMPLWVQEGGYPEWKRRLQDPENRSRVKAEIRNPSDEFTSGIVNAGGPEGVLLVGFRNPELRKYIGMTLADVAEERGTSPEDTAMDLVIEDDSRVQVVYFSMSEKNIAKKVALPWVSFGSDGGAFAPEGVFLNRSTHPRAYGNFARVLGKYARDEKVISLEEAIRKLTSLPAANLKLRDRGTLKEGMYADIVIFDPDTVTDHATFAEPHQLATGVNHVFVNGVHTIKDGKHTGAEAGRVVRGPGWVGWADAK